MMKAPAGVRECSARSSKCAVNMLVFRTLCVWVCLNVFRNVNDHSLFYKMIWRGLVGGVSVMLGFVFKVSIRAAKFGDMGISALALGTGKASRDGPTTVGASPNIGSFLSIHA
jgi:hypothetical protein